MLILSRRIGESLRIGDDITVTVLETQGKTAQIGIDAPQEMRVERAEVAERRRADSAAQGDASESPE